MWIQYRGFTLHEYESNVAIICNMCLHSLVFIQIDNPRKILDEAYVLNISTYSFITFGYSRSLTTLKLVL